MPATGAILVLIEHENGVLRSISAELLGAAKRIAVELDRMVTAVAFGSGSEVAAGEAISFGADEALASADPGFDEYRNDVWTSALATVAGQVQPSAVLIGQTEIGRDLAPRFAIRAGTAAATDCIDLAVRDGNLLMTRPCFGGNAHATYVSRTLPSVATVRPRSQAPLPRDESRTGAVSNLDLGPIASTSVIAGREIVESTGQRLEDAKVIISGGRGLGSAEAFDELATLARVLGGAVAASRAAVDLGWAPISAQVGLTGKVVTPDLYVAIAISGASQHIAGITGAQTIVGVNRDQNADIFKYARYGVVADWKAFLPAFTQACRALTGTINQ
jgi:electron transfer flavoprotein alpha subunit